MIILFPLIEICYYIFRYINDYIFSIEYIEYALGETELLSVASSLFSKINRNYKALFFQN